MQVKTIMRHHYTLNRKTKIIMTESTKCLPYRNSHWRHIPATDLEYLPRRDTPGIPLGRFCICFTAVNTWLLDRVGCWPCEVCNHIPTKKTCLLYESQVFTFGSWSIPKVGSRLLDVLGLFFFFFRFLVTFLSSQ